MKKLLTLIVILSVGFINGQEIMYSNKNLTVVDNQNDTYTFTYGKQYQYTSTVKTEDKQVIDNLISTANNLLNSKRPGLSSELVVTVDNYKVIRNRWNLYIKEVTTTTSTKVTTSGVQVQRLNGTVRPINAGTLYIPRIYVPRYYSRPYYRYYSRF